jgi:hypothetical protein
MPPQIEDRLQALLRVQGKVTETSEGGKTKRRSDFRASIRRRKIKDN